MKGAQGKDPQVCTHCVTAASKEGFTLDTQNHANADELVTVGEVTEINKPRMKDDAAC